MAINTIEFSPTAVGESKSVGTWGVDTAWPNYDNVRQSIENIGRSNVDIVRMLVYVDEPLVDLGSGNYELNAAAKAKVNQHLELAQQLGINVPYTLGIGGSDPDSIDPSYVSGSGINVTNYARVIKATQEYINSRPNFTSSPLYAVEPFNEPDFNFTQANPADLNSIIAELKTYPAFDDTYFMAPSTLNSDNAQWWYDQVPEATAGSSHLLAGSLTSWTNFIDHVENTGNPFMNPELHSMGEILAGAERGMTMGMVWADVLRGRGTLIQASDGDRLGYAEDFGNQSAGAVYRAPDGELYAFAGGLERDYTGSPSVYRFVSTDQDVYFNGIRVREYMLQTNTDHVVSDTDNDFANDGSWSSEGAYADIDFDDSGVPALDGYRWKIVNALDGSVMEVVDGGTNDGAQIRSASDDGGLNQLWRITRTRNGYYHLYNANSGRTAEVAGRSLGNGGDVIQWGTADHSGQQWYVDEAGNGSFYLRNANSHMYLDADLGSTNIIQWQFNGGLNQQWQFVLANPTDGPTAQYLLRGNANDSVGSNHATTHGSPTYTTGPIGRANQAIVLDGADDYLQLPSGIASSEDLTIATWVKWNGGGDWQRIFDFGNDTNSYMFLTPQAPDGTMRFAITDSSNGGEQILATDALPIGEWVHLAITLGGNTGILYINGQPQVAGQILLDPTDINPTINLIGDSQWASDPLFSGSLADFQIYDYALTPEQIAALLPTNSGDFNNDGIVNLADYTLWRDHLGLTGQALYSPGDANGDGAVDAADYSIWKANFGRTVSSGGVRIDALAAVPEPASVSCALLALVVAASFGRRLGRGSIR
ncbi:Ricin-type beta-trefoil lectin domain protein [Aeoliella mucimassa]|uniref:Ricin-type beta-trefoil lectin domain protein n=2 Tax=Aeoliella mucimassa TaxID=2527972 RepID=A0A518ARL3_9BACT|nr:Ricin-type beta-trefoil lectin domain protein [Aeoliella mucimassa]